MLEFGSVFFSPFTGLQVIVSSFIQAQWWIFICSELQFGTLALPFPVLTWATLVLVLIRVGLGTVARWNTYEMYSSHVKHQQCQTTTNRLLSWCAKQLTVLTTTVPSRLGCAAGAQSKKKIPGWNASSCPDISLYQGEGLLPYDAWTLHWRHRHCVLEEPGSKAVIRQQGSPEKIPEKDKFPAGVFYPWWIF